MVVGNRRKRLSERMTRTELLELVTAALSKAGERG